MIQKLIQNFLGISDLKAKLHNLDNDIISIMEKQLGQEMETLPPDSPECNKNSPYEYKTDLLKGDVAYAWYAIWSTGFSGPFQTFEEADKYVDHNNLRLCKFIDIQLLYQNQFEVKK